MSFASRMAVAGLPAAGVTVFAALAFSGAPATAAVGDAAARPAVMTTPCADTERTKCGYGDDSTAPGAADTVTSPTDAVSPAGAGTLPTRGNDDYGSVSPTTATTTPTTTSPTTTSPTTTSPTSPAPTGSTDTVPPGGVSPSSVSPATASPRPSASQGGGVSAGSTLPVTGAPMGAVVSLGGMLVAAGAVSLWYTRRRRSA
ncbi:hypothetical protein ACWKSP_10235 [Micromonosporaceae bacterium Da 78-11]